MAAARTTDAGLQKALAVLAKGERLEPQNAFYDYLKAALLMKRSSHLVDNEGIRFSYVDRRGEKKEECGGRLVIDDPATFDRALAQVHEAVSKPYYNAHTAEIVERKLALARPPRTLGHQLANDRPLKQRGAESDNTGARRQRGWEDGSCGAQDLEVVEPPCVVT